jgi:hypothetical protein
MRSYLFSGSSDFDCSYQAQYIACVHAKQHPCPCRCAALDESFPTSGSAKDLRRMMAHPGPHGPIFRGEIIAISPRSLRPDLPIPTPGNALVRGAGWLTEPLWFPTHRMPSSTKCGVVFWKMGNPGPSGIPAGRSLMWPDHRTRLRWHKRFKAIPSSERRHACVLGEGGHLVACLVRRLPQSHAPRESKLLTVNRGGQYAPSTVLYTPLARGVPRL